MDTIYTIGYGRRSIHEFIDLLRRYEITRLVDIRSHPVSRWNPAFRKKVLQEYLESAGITYLWLGDALGGKPADPTLWDGNALDMDVLESQPWFQAGMAELIAATRQGARQAIMCAELRPESCHRNWMVGTLLDEQGITVLHIDENGALKTQDQVRGI